MSSKKSPCSMFWVQGQEVTLTERMDVIVVVATYGMTIPIQQASAFAQEMVTTQMVTPLASVLDEKQ